MGTNRGGETAQGQRAKWTLRRGRAEMDGEDNPRFSAYLFGT